MVRIPEFQWGTSKISDAGIAGLPAGFPGEKDVASWYSLKTAHPVNGLLGPNAFKAFRVEIDYADSAVYLEKGAGIDGHDMDIVGLTLRPLNDKRYQVIGVLNKDGKQLLEGIDPGDILLQVGDFKASGATMGTVIDALRGKPGDIRVLKLERKGKPFTVTAAVERIL